MNFSILIPHYRTPKMTAYTIAQILKYKGNHDIEIIIIDNHAKIGDDSYRYLEPFVYDIVYIPYPTDKLQSHGIGINYLLEHGLVRNEWFIPLETDAFPTSESWLDYFENIINEGYDAAVNMLKLSGGLYGHPCASLFNKTLWQEADDYFKSLPYVYFPNMAMKDNFQSHLMVHKNIVKDVVTNPDDYIELANGYKNLTAEAIMQKAYDYSPTTCAFHHGMGGLNESVNNYGQRCAEIDVPNILVEGKRKLIYRVGYEPGQALYYWMIAMNKKVFNIPIETTWMPNREGQQQEYTINEAGIKHLWAISSYTERGSKDVEDIYEAKRRIPDELYETLPEHQKIKQHI